MSLCKLRQFRISSALDDGRQLSASLQNHIDACPRCRGFHQQSCAIAASLVPAAAPDAPAWLHTKIMARVRSAEPVATAAAPRRWLPAVAGLAAIAVAAGLITLKFQKNAIPPEEQAVAWSPPVPVTPHPASVTDRLERHAKQALSNEFHHLATDIAGAKNFLTASLRSTLPSLGDEE